MQAGFRHRGDNGVNTAEERRCDADGDQDRAEQHDQLYDVGNNHCTHSTDGVVDDRDHAEQDHGRHEVGFQTDGEYEPDAVDRHAGCEGAYELERQGQGQARCQPESAFEEFVDRDQAKPPERGQEQGHHGDHGKGHGELVLQPQQAASRRECHEGRRTENAVRRALGCHGRQRDRQCSGTVAAQVVVASINLSACDDDRNADHRREVGRNDNPVEHGHEVVPLSRGIIGSADRAAALKFERARRPG